MGGTNTFKPTEDNVKIIGRTHYQDGSLWVCHTDSGIEYKFNGKTTTIVISPDSVYGSLSEETPAHIFVYGDDKRYIDTLTKEKSMKLTIEFDAIGEHVVRLLKVSECQYGSIYINDIITDSDKIFPTPEKEKKIEFIGDSITCAFGSLDAEGDFKTANEDGTKSYAYKVAQKFNADYSLFSFSGYGIYSGVTFTGMRNKDLLLPPKYDKLGELLWNNIHPESTTLAMREVNWDHHKFEPDLIIINLGVNDATYITSITDKKLIEEEKAVFKEEYKKFIKHVRAAHPNSEILCTLGVMEDILYPQVETAVHDYCNESKDAKINVFKLNPQNVAKNGIAILTHPNVLSQVDAAYEVIAEIEKLYGWKSNPNLDISETMKK